jgi:hypothetical protein
LQTDPYDPTPRVWSLRRTTVLKPIFWSPAITQPLRYLSCTLENLEPSIRCAIIRTRMRTNLKHWPIFYNIR